MLEMQFKFKLQKVHTKRIMEVMTKLNTMGECVEEIGVKMSKGMH